MTERTPVDYVDPIHAASAMPPAEPESLQEAIYKGLQKLAAAGHVTHVQADTTFQFILNLWGTISCENVRKMLAQNAIKLLQDAVTVQAIDALMGRRAPERAS